MTRRVWKHWQPNSLQSAIEGCIEFARDQKNLSVDQIADRMGVASKWTLYKWIQSAAIPAHMIRPFELACGATYVTRYLATSAHQLLVPMPTGRVASTSDVATLQAVCTAAVQALIEFNGGKRSADDTVACITTAMTSLATERGHVERSHQPEIDFQ